MESFHAESREFIRRLRLDEDRVNRLGRRAVALRDGIRDLATDGGGGGGVEPVCTTTITGTIEGGLAGSGLAGSTIQVTGHVTATDYGTFDATDGTYSINLVLDAADDSVDLVVTGPGVRFTAGSAVNQRVTQCVTNAVANIKATPATGYVYMTGVQACAYPLKTTLSYTDTEIGSGTATWNGTNWLACKVATSRAAGSCPAGVSAAVFLNFNTNGSATSAFASLATGGCPTTSTCTWTGPTTGGFAVNVGGHTAKTCPDGSTLFAMTFPHTIGTTNGAAMFDPAGSITFFET